MKAAPQPSSGCFWCSNPAPDNNGMEVIDSNGIGYHDNPGLVGGLFCPTQSKANGFYDPVEAKFAEDMASTSNVVVGSVEFVPTSRVMPPAPSPRPLGPGSTQQYQPVAKLSVARPPVRSKITTVLPDGSRYEGQVDSKGRPEGEGRVMHPDGDSYAGQWKLGVAHGEGTYWHADGAFYRGQWEKDRKEGRGIEEWVDGARFEGEYVDGYKKGFGAFLWPNGASYAGQLNSDEFSGDGTYIAADGRWYKGQWAKGVMSGQGRYCFPDGRIYQGEYKDSKRHGQGVFTWEDGRRYEGQWVEDQEHGYGVWSNEAGERKEGEWRQGEFFKWAEGNAQFNSKQWKDLEKVLQDAVQLQVEDFKRERGSLACEQSKRELTMDSVKIMYHPTPFPDLIQHFLTEAGLKPEMILKACRDGPYDRMGRPTKIIEDKVIRERWETFHLLHAHYKVLHIEEKAAGPGGGVWMP